MKRLEQTTPEPPEGFDKKQTKEETARLIGRLQELQNLLYAEARHAVLVILQGLDASGKDGAIRKVLGQMNPQGVVVHSFKVPTEEELSHDFLWRVHQHAPAKGMIGVFNRSQYEDVLVTRVHGLIDDETARKRFAAINHFEELLQEHNATSIFKFYLHISREEQEERLHERKEDPTKQWKFNPGDEKEAKQWEKYQEAYEDVFENCSGVPWTIVPANRNWYKEYLIARTLVDGLESLHMKYPHMGERGA